MTTSEQPKPTVGGGIVAIIVLILAGYLIYQSVALLNL